MKGTGRRDLMGSLDVLIAATPYQWALNAGATPMKLQT